MIRLREARLPRAVALLVAVAAVCGATGGLAVAGARPAGRSRDPFLVRPVIGAAGRTDPSGEPMPVGDLPGWRQVFADDFTHDVPLGGFSGCTWAGTVASSRCSGLPRAVAAKWWAYPDGWSDDQHHHARYFPSRVLSIHNGVLDYDLHTQDGVPLVAAAVPRIPAGSDDSGHRYGAYVVRFRADPLPGYATAWLLWPDSEIWPSQGEIDFPEGDLDGTFSGFMHYMHATAGDQADVFETHAHYDAWHTAVIEWTPRSCRFILDGRLVGTATHRVPSDPMHWVLQTETAIDGTVSPAATGHVEIDWVVAYVPDRRARR